MSLSALQEGANFLVELPTILLEMHTMTCLAQENKTLRG